MRGGRSGSVHLEHTEIERDGQLRGQRIGTTMQRKDGGVLQHERTFQTEKEFLRLDATGITHQRAVRTDHPVTRDDDRDGVRGVCATDGLESTARPEPLCELLVGDGRPVGDLGELLPNAKLERGSEEIDRRGELGETTVKVSVQLIDDVPVLRFVVDHFVVVKIVAQPPQKIPLALPRNTDLADALIRRSNIDQADLGFERCAIHHESRSRGEEDAGLAFGF